MAMPAEKAKRPIAITIICVIGFIGAAISISVIFSSVASGIGAWYPPYLALASIVGLVCMIGLWMMKKWAVFVYTGLLVVNQVVMLAMGVWNPLALVIPLIVVVIAFMNLSKMS
jgi:hypothetical protein